MQNIIKITDTSINVQKIMSNIVQKARKINMNNAMDDLDSLSEHGIEEDISPIILNYIKRPTSRKSGFLSKFANKVITKIFYVMWNSLGDIFTQQQSINKHLMKKVRYLQNKIDELNGELVRVQYNQPRNFLENFDYVEFENIMRGDVGTISDRQETYLKYVDPSKTILDIGCGRGEFLKLLVNDGINAEGVDINQDMISICRSQGLNVYNSEGTEYLRNTDKKFGAIFAAHVIEHMEYNEMIELINLAYERLENNGCLILETPNPKTVGTHIGGFYSDPTHLHFVHPSTLQFICEKAGFDEVNIIYKTLQDHRLKIDENFDEITKANLKRLNEVLFGYLEYAIIAFKRNEN